METSLCLCSGMSESGVILHSDDTGKHEDGVHNTIYSVFSCINYSITIYLVPMTPLPPHCTEEPGERPEQPDIVEFDQVDLMHADWNGLVCSTTVAVYLYRTLKRHRCSSVTTMKY